MFSCEFCIIFKNRAEHLYTTEKEITNIERPNGPVHGNPKRDVGEKMFCEKYPYRVKVRFIPLTFLFVIVTHFSQLRSHCVCYNNTFLVTLVKFIPQTFLFSFLVINLENLNRTASSKCFHMLLWKFLACYYKSC